jgi:Rrf2 family transcriptional regulator, iron-sulfur cluster assembly transcription factor
MLFTKPTEYAIRGISELACRSPDRLLMLDALVVDTDLPRDFLAKLFQKLVKAGLLRSSKGRGGGFMLGKPAHEITLMQIVEAIEGPQPLDGCVIGLSQCNDQMPCSQHDTYKPIRQRLKDYLNTTTLADLSASLKSKASWRELHKAEEMNGKPRRE